MSFAELAAQHRRLSILRLLAEATENTANESILHAALGELGLHCSRDQARADIAWLHEQGLLLSESIGAGLVVATLTERGDDVQAGRALHPGVKRPSPRG